MPQDEGETTAMDKAMVMVGNVTDIFEEGNDEPVDQEIALRACDMLRSPGAGEWVTIKCGMAGHFIKIVNAAGRVSLCGIQAFGY